MPLPFKVKAVFEYRSEEPDDLNFDNGQIITVTEEDDADWYTGEYNDASGQKIEGLFPRNFVEKYEPAIPSRPTRAPRRQPKDEQEPQEATTNVSTSDAQRSTEVQTNPPKELNKVEQDEEIITQPPLEKPQTFQVPSVRAETQSVATKAPPPVADKPSSNSFRDRIAAFNKPAAAPVTPFKSGANSGTGFIKKTFVAPPPNRNAYVPPPTQPAPQKIYRREEPSAQNEADEVTQVQEDVVRSEDQPAEDQPKPTSLKDRIALLQQQQLEQAARNSEKKKTKRPPTQRSESAETFGENATSTEAPLSRQQTGDTIGKKSIDVTHPEESEGLEASGATTSEVAIPTTIPPPSRELVSDTNDADDDGGAEDTEDAPGTSTEEDRHKPANIKPTPSTADRIEGDDRSEDDEEAEEDEDEDPEVRRRRELRERMAKMSGGMGMMGMFGGGMPAPAKKAKTSKDVEPQIPDTYQQEEMQRAPPVPLMAMPGMTLSPRQTETEVEDIGNEDVISPKPMPPVRRTTGESSEYIGQPKRTSTDRSAPRPPEDRTVPAPPSKETRSTVSPTSSAILPPEFPESPPVRSIPPPLPLTSTGETPLSPMGENVPSVPSRSSIDRKASTKMSSTPAVAPSVPSRTSTNGQSINVANSPSSERRVSRPPPPPVPSVPPVSTQVRAPPPPPGQPPSRKSTSESVGPIESPRYDDDDSDAEVTEYDGDYDTDIASSAKHKDALKSHNRDSSIDDEGVFTDDAAHQATSPPARAVPPPPPVGPPRNIPPPIPQSAPQSTPKPRKSTEAPNALPPPIPSGSPAGEDDYDPYRYTSTQQSMPTPPLRAPLSPPLRSPTREIEEEEDMYSASSQRPTRVPPPPISSLPPIPADRAVPPPPPFERAAPPPPPTGPLPPVPSATPTVMTPGPPRQSLDVSRQTNVRRSVEVARPSADYGFIASDLDLGETSGWWTYDNTPPPSVQARGDVLYEIESSTSTKRGGKTTITRDVYVLYADHSQTTINVAFDPSDPSQLSITQSHERPPPPPRQDQLESASEAFGAQIARAASSASGNGIGDGSAQSFVQELLRPFQSTALMPIGARSYGALVYANLANASTQQFDEIRPGDILTFRNAKFAGHRGGLHTKYSMDVGRPDHVSVVIDWDGTKKKIRAWEQGREDKGKKPKVREESFRIGDLKSGEVRVWRVMPRSWVGWNKS